MGVEVEVLDHGEGPPLNQRVLPHGRRSVCWQEIAGGWSYAEPHDWHPFPDGSPGTLWYCSRCRRVERRTVESQ